LSSDIARSLRRLKPEKHLRQLTPRGRGQLEFLDPLSLPPRKLLLDTTVYIDELQGRLPRAAELALRVSELWHSSVTEAELSALAGLLHPRHHGTAKAVRQVTAVMERRPRHRILTPDAEAWREAGILAGTLARLQGYAKAGRGRVLNDALILLSAAKNGCTVLTRNVADFDLLMQLAPFAKAVFYTRE